MMKSVLATLLLLLVVGALAIPGVERKTASQNIVGTIRQSGEIVYQKTNFLKIPNILNPVNMSLETGNSTTLFACFSHAQKDFPANIYAMGLLCSAPAAQLPFAPTQPINGTTTMKRMLRTSSQRGSALMKLVEDTTSFETQADLQVNIFPSDGKAGVTVLGDPTTYNITIEYEYCENGLYPVGENNSCVNIDEVAYPSNTSLSISPSSWSYYSFTVNSFNANTSNLITISLVNSTSQIFLQQNYYPTSDFYTLQGTSQTPITLGTPAYFSSSQTFFVGIFNPSTTDDNGVLSIAVSICNQTTNFGPACEVNPVSTSAEPINQVNTIPIAITKGIQSSTVNNGTSYEFSQYTELTIEPYPQYLFFSLPNPTANYTLEAVRVSVGLNDASSTNTPALYAKLGGYPSTGSFDISLPAGFGAQLALPVPTSPEVWYLAVLLPANSFSIWVGTNCANNCSNEDHGYCICSYKGATENCLDLVGAGGENFENFYYFPTNIEESFGICHCEDDVFEGFECNVITSYEEVWVLLIVVIITSIVLTVIIAVPSYLYLKHKKKMQFERL